MSIGPAIKLVRLKLRLTPQEVYESAQLTQGFYNGLEHGRSSASIDTLKRISNALGVPLIVLIYYATDKKEIPKNQREYFQSIEPSIELFIKKASKKHE